MAGEVLLLGHQETRHVMGVTATVTVHAVDPRRLIEEAFSLLNRYEMLWSRFIPTSDLSRLNHAQGRSIVVDPSTIDLITFMKRAHTATDGLYNPTLLPRHRELHDVLSLVDDKRCDIPASAMIWNHLNDITIVSDAEVSIPDTMTLDAGGVGKGFSADLVVEHLLALGAQSVSVNLGGDARVASAPSARESWNFDVVSLGASDTVSTISLINGAIATSSIDARYRGGIGPQKHVFSVDNSESHCRMCSVIAGEARWAEVWTKYVMLASSPRAAMTQNNLTALIVDDNGVPYTTESWKEFEL